MRPANGTYALYKWSGAWTALQPYTPAPAINLGEARNRLRVVCQGSEITVFINGTQLITVSDSELVSGQIGLSVSGEGMAARFDNLTVRLPSLDPATSVAVQQPAAAPTAAPASELPAAPPEAPPGWRLILNEAFDSNVHNWPTGSVEGEYARYRSEFAQGRYDLHAVLQEGKSSALVMQTIRVDVGLGFHATIEVAPTGDSEQACGLRVADAGNANSTVFMVSDANGKFRVRRQDSSGTWRTLIEWTSSDAIHAGQVNRLSVIGDSLGLAFFVNGQRVSVADVGQIDVQRVGVTAHVWSGDPVLCSFDNLQVRVGP